MMGDNRDNSLDSRMQDSGVGFVPAENLVGRAEFLFFSTDGSAAWWEVWKWPFAIRYGRLFTAIREDDAEGSRPRSPVRDLGSPLRGPAASRGSAHPPERARS